MNSQTVLIKKDVDVEVNECVVEQISWTTAPKSLVPKPNPKKNICTFRFLSSFFTNKVTIPLISTKFFATAGHFTQNLEFLKHNTSLLQTRMQPQRNDDGYVICIYIYWKINLCFVEWAAGRNFLMPNLVLARFLCERHITSAGWNLGSCQGKKMMVWWCTFI